MDDDAPDVFDAIHAELDAIPPESWTDPEASLVLASLARIRRARNPIRDLSCFASSRLRRRRRFDIAG